MTLKRVFVLVLAAVMVTACSDYQNRPRQTAGTVIGAAGGGLLGSQFGSGRGQLVGTALGVLLGAWIGSEVGRSMDEVDRQRAQQAHVQALDTGQTIRWDNPNNGHYGSVAPIRSGTDTQSGAFCREFQSTVMIGGQQQQAYGTACRQPDGSWRITDN